MSLSVKALNDRFAAGGAIRFAAGAGGLVHADIVTSLADARLQLDGAQVTRYRPHGERDLLFLSDAALFERGRSLRGGVPLVFPWFGSRADDPSAPMHGFARGSEWTVVSTARAADGAVTVVLELAADSATHAAWPRAFRLRYRVTVGARLELALGVENVSPEPFVFEDALHTYLAVSDLREVSVRGLEDTPYIDKTDAMARKRDGPDALRLRGETDRVYLGTRATCIVDDPGWGRRVFVEKSGSATTVIWNPWCDKARTIADLRAEEWSRMLCVETANAADDAVTLAPGARHETRAVLWCEARSR